MSIENRISQVTSKFTEFSEWEDRYRVLIKIGKNLEELSEDKKQSKFEVKGCQSKVWLVPKLKDGLVYFNADSDAILVKGIIGLLLEVYSGSSSDEIISHPPNFLKEIGITEHLSMNRTNGLASMVKQIQMYATLFKSLTDKGIKDADL